MIFTPQPIAASEYENVQSVLTKSADSPNAASDAPSSPPKMPTQIELEQQALEKGRVRYLKSEASLIKEGRAGETSGGRDIIQQVVEPLAMAIEKGRAEAEHKAGPGHALLSLFNKLNAKTVAFVTSRVAIDHAFRPSGRTVTSAYIDIADTLLLEIQSGEFRACEPYLYATMETRLNKNPGGKRPKTRRDILRYNLPKDRYGFTSWGQATKAQIGSTLFDMFKNATGLISIESRKVWGRTEEWLRPADLLIEWMEKKTLHSSLLRPALEPMVEKPKEWKALSDGGYHTLKTGRMGFVKFRFDEHQNAIKDSDLVESFSSVNSLQNTAWRVNRWLLDQVDKAIDLELTVGNSVIGPDISVPPRPAVAGPSLHAWKAEAAEAYRANKKKAGRRKQQAGTLRVAWDFVSTTELYFPYQLDFRGRVYAMPSHLNPQGNDLAKALLEFAHGKPLGAIGKKWLYIHTANCFGVDKVSFDDRIRWVESNREQLIATAADPFADTWWMEADNPWQFLASCKSLARSVVQGDDYICHLPVSVDGSNNGLQHFSAMLRDESCGALVNLVPTDEPADVYRAVAERVEAIIDELVKCSDHPDAEAVRREIAKVAGPEMEEAAACRPLSMKWKQFGINRSLCKGPVMIMPYGGTRDGFRREIIDRIENSMSSIFKGHVSKAATLLAIIIERVLDADLPGPRQAMEWLQAVSRQFAEQNAPIMWESPQGFVVLQDYCKRKSMRVKSFKFGMIKVRKNITVSTDLPELDKKKQTQSFAPNFVHSMDAAALMKTIVAASAQGLTDFTVVHDSFGTHACDMDKLQEILRSVFVKMYTPDVLGNLKSQLEKRLGISLPELPGAGSLDIGNVRASKYFFA